MDTASFRPKNKNSIKQEITPRATKEPPLSSRSFNTPISTIASRYKLPTPELKLYSESARVSLSSPPSFSPNKDTSNKGGNSNWECSPTPRRNKPVSSTVEATTTPAAVTSGSKPTESPTKGVTSTKNETNQAENAAKKPVQEAKVESAGTTTKTTSTDVKQPVLTQKQTPSKSTVKEPGLTENKSSSEPSENKSNLTENKPDSTKDKSKPKENKTDLPESKSSTKLAENKQVDQTYKKSVTIQESKEITKTGKRDTQDSKVSGEAKVVEKSTSRNDSRFAKDTRNVPSKSAPQRGRDGEKEGGRKLEAKKSSEVTSSRSRTLLALHKEPTYVIVGGNGVALVDSILSELGWKRQDKQHENFKLKWVECNGSINFSSFREGEQMVNRIPNCSLLTNKMGLLSSLQAYDRVYGTSKRGPRLKYTDIIPETFRLEEPKEREAFYDAFKEGEIWICKPTGMNQGKGIYLVRDLDEFKRNQQEKEERAKPHKRSMGRIIQRYIMDPLLLDGRKFDIRAYMFVASTTPFLVLYHKGYVRLSMHKYENDSNNLTAHLTNQYIQKKDPNYKDAKEDTAWSMDKFNDYINEKVAPEKGLEPDWVYTTLTTRMRQIMTHCFNAVKHKLQCKMGYFDLYGLDFMIDESMKVWLIEVNVNPALSCNCEALREVIPGVVKEALNLAIECFEKNKRSQPLLPLQSLSSFQILHNGSGNRSNRTSTSPTRAQGADNLNNGAVLRSRSLSPVRRTHSLSPVKDPSTSVSPAEKDSNGNNNKRSVAVTPRITPKATNMTTTPGFRAAPHPVYERSPYSMAVATADPIRFKMTHAGSGKQKSAMKEKNDRGN